MITGKIYKLIDMVNQNYYIGSTSKTLSDRKSCHKYDSGISSERNMYSVQRTL